MRLRDLDAQGAIVAEQFDLGRWFTTAMADDCCAAAARQRCASSSKPTAACAASIRRASRCRACSAGPRSTASTGRCACVACTSTWPMRPASANAEGNRVRGFGG
jgi:hypothetical protein